MSRVQKGFRATETGEPLVKVSLSVYVKEKEWNWLLDKALRSGWSRDELLTYIGTSGVETAATRVWECDEE